MPSISNEIEDNLKNSYDIIKNNLYLPTLIVIIIVICFMYILLSMFLGTDSNYGSNTEIYSNENTFFSYMVHFLVTIMVFLLSILVIIGIIVYIYDIDIFTYIQKMLLYTMSYTYNPVPVSVPVPDTDDDDIEENIPEEPVPLQKQQVFNIPENQFTYNDARAVCSAYGARLASYSELEEAYNNGGEWCNYGWSENQMALFPTQKQTYEDLQKIKGHENDCGRPGINGGYMKNTDILYGANCYGYKPRMTISEEDRMATDPIYPKTQKDAIMEDRVKYWKDRLCKLIVNPFNKSNWSQI